jgi:lysyl endopeptidase
LVQRIYAGSLSNTMNTINVANLADGFYFLYLVDEESKDSITKKIIVKK